MLFPSYYDRPTNIKFAEQETDEHIELFLRQHGFTNLSWMLMALVGYFVPLIFTQVIPTFTLLGVQIPDNIFQAAILLWYLGLVAFIVAHFLYWYFNIYIITNKHLIDITLDSLLSSTVTETQLSDVQSTRYQFRGILGSLFRYGNVMIETAAKDQTIDFLGVPKPDKISDRIEDLQGGHPEE